jgi:hypothetical protein
MKKILTYSLVLALVIALLSTCSVTEDIVPPTVTNDTTITDAERMDVFKACNKKSAELNNLKNLEDRVSFVAWLTTQSAFYSRDLRAKTSMPFFRMVALFYLLTHHWMKMSEEGPPPAGHLN